MMTRTTLCSLPLLAALGAAAAPALAGGMAQVAYDKDGESFMDFGRTPTDRAANAIQLTQVLTGLADKHLADGQTLAVTVLDVDLAGELKPAWRRGGDEMRVVGSGADWPKLKLRWTLRQGDATVSQGEETLADMSYQFGIRPSSLNTLPYEARMLDDWFRRQFGGAH